MSKPYSEADLAEQLTADRTWRVREISDLKSAIVRADAGLQQVLLRSLIAIAYAHWEGSVRFSAAKYLEHIALRKLSYRQLDRQFIRNRFLARLAALSTSKTSISDRCALVDEILSGSDDRFSRVNPDWVNTKSNLNSEVFQDICLICGLPGDTFRDEGIFIDIYLLKRRNSIAHGEETFIGLGDLDNIANNTISLMRAFGDALENQASLKTYMAA